MLLQARSMHFVHILMAILACAGFADATLDIMKFVPEVITVTTVQNRPTGLPQIPKVPFDIQRLPCPEGCSTAGTSPANWTVYNDLHRLAICNETMLLDFAVYNALEDPETDVRLRSCTADVATKLNDIPIREVNCPATADLIEVQQSVQMAFIDAVIPSKSSKASDLVNAGRQMQNHLAQTAVGCTANDTTIFAYRNRAILGLYAGSEIRNQQLSSSILENFLTYINTQSLLDRNGVLIQLCGSKDRGADYTMGIIASVDGNLATVQNAVKTWSNGECLTAYNETSSWTTANFMAPALVETNITIANSTFAAPESLKSNHSGRSILRRASCRTIQVVSGDSCASLASKCQTTGADFTRYNPGATFCSTLKPGQHVCCSVGTLPDFSPKPNADGTCASYVVKAGDFCDKIASSNSLTIAKLETFNKITWGWTGCNNLMAGVKMCLSTGRPPMPAPVPNAICGPQVPNTPPPPAGVALANLNPCLLMACCNIWGQCGTTDEFCTISMSTTGAPGTAAPGKNGCIANCGTAIISSAPPQQFRRIAYFEAFNKERDCLHMDVTDIDITKFTHIHFAFAEITQDFKVDVSAVQDQFDLFVGMTGIKRILSFGGWSFSTDLDTYPIFGQAVSAANRELFAKNVVAFATQHNLDGVDFDWEYPGAPDIPGIPAGSPHDGIHYFVFLSTMRTYLPRTMSLAIAAPASYWYLKGFPIEAMSYFTDYIVFMTYDLHGQWDYGSKWSSPGCSDGNCLRSHVNITETINALSMITKSGVPSNKVVVGVTSYGRSFRMTTRGCTGENCRFTGPASGAAKGECTNTAGYISNAEINDIIINGGNIQTFRDPSYSNILVYNDLEWVAYMDDNNKNVRIALYESLQFGGISDWAVDLASFGSDAAGSGNSDLIVSCDKIYETVDAVSADTSIPDTCMNQYIIGALSRTIRGAIDTFNDILSDGYDGKFRAYEEQVKSQVPLAMDKFRTEKLSDFFTCIYSVSIGGGKFRNQTGPSCSQEKLPSSLKGHPWNRYHVPKDLEAFYHFLEESYGVDRSWVDFKNEQYSYCLPQQQDCSTFGNWLGIPAAKPDIEVPNPKELIKSGLSNLVALREFLADVELEESVGLFFDSTADVIDAASLPSYMVLSSVKNMQEVADIGEKVEKEKEKRMILLFVSVFLIFIPFVGKVLSAVVGAAAIGRIITLAAVGTEVAFTIAEIADDPANAPLAVMSLLLGGLGGASRAGKLSQAASIRRGMSPKVIEDLGKDVAMNMATVARLVKSCAR